MAKAGTQSEAAVSPQTRCTSCRTVFEVSPELLSSSDTRVRCGECLSIFDALANLRDPESDERDAAPEESTEDDAAPPSDGEQTPAERTANEAAAASFAEVADGAGPIEVTYTDFDLFSREADLPEVSYLDATADFEFDEIEDETFSDTLFENDATVETDADEAGSELTIDAAEAALGPETDFVVDEEPAEAIEFRYHDAGRGERSGENRTDGRSEESRDDDRSGESGADGRSEESGDDERPDESGADERSDESRADEPSEAGAAAPPAPTSGFPPISADAPPPAAGGAGGLDVLPTKGGAWLTPVLLLLLLAALLVGLYVHRWRDELHNDPLVRPLLVLGCRVSGCTVPSRVDLAALRLVGREVYTHPSVPGALVIGVTFENTADFDQRYPVLVVRLRDRTGRAVAERAFEPAEYLERWREGDTIAADERLDISLEVDDPGEGADSYEFEFREARA